MSEIENELLDEVKELRRVVHAGLAVLAAQIIATRDNTKNEKEYASEAFLQIQDVLSSLRQGD